MPLILGTNSIKDTGFNVDNSLRFNSGSSDNLSRTPGSSSAAGRKKFTISAWVKRGNLTAEMGIFSGGPDSNVSGFYTLMFDDADKLRVQYYEDAFYNIMPNMLFRDLSAWYHIVVSNDTTNGTSANRTKIYVNGVQQAVVSASGGTAEQPNSDFDYNVNNDSLQQVGARRNSGGSPAGYFDGYIAEFCMIDNQALAADQFGEFDSDSGIWKPIDVSGLTFGTNGFYLEFKGAGTSANASGMGADTSGNTHHFTVGNLTAVDQSTDTCTNNFATFNSLIPQAEIAYSEGNLIATDSGSGGNSRTSLSTIAPSSGKWYAEFKLITDGGDYPNIGIWSTEVAYVVTDNVGKPDDTYAWNSSSSGRVFSNNTTIGSTGVGTYAEGNIVQIALDLDNNYIYFGVNGTYITSGDPTSGSNGTGGFAIASGLNYYFATTTNTNGAWGANFGSPSFAISSSNTDGSGFGNFEYAVPSGYFALCTKNLAEYG